MDSSQQACLPLDQGPEFKFALTQRTRVSTRKGRSTESTGSIIRINHSGISSAHSVQKETRHEYHLIMCRFFFVSTNPGNRLRGTNNYAWNSSRFTTLERNFARSKTGLLASLPQSNDRDIVAAGEPHFPTIIIAQTSNLGFWQVSSQFFSAGWRGQGREQASHLWEHYKPQWSIHTRLLNPQRFDGDVL